MSFSVSVGFRSATRLTGLRPTGIYVPKLLSLTPPSSPGSSREPTTG